MLDTIIGRASRLDLGELPKIITKTICTTTVEARPKSRLTQRHATSCGHVRIIISRATDHVRMRFDEAHLESYTLLTLTGPSPTCSLAMSNCNGLLSWITEGHQYIVCTIVAAVIQPLHGIAKGFQPEIRVALRSFHTIEKRGNINQLVPRIHEILIQNFLTCHSHNA